MEESSTSMSEDAKQVECISDIVHQWLSSSLSPKSVFPEVLDKLQIQLYTGFALEWHKLQKSFQSGRFAMFELTRALPKPSLSRFASFKLKLLPLLSSQVPPLHCSSTAFPTSVFLLLLITSIW